MCRGTRSRVKSREVISDVEGGWGAVRPVRLLYSKIQSWTLRLEALELVLQAKSPSSPQLSLHDNYCWSLDSFRASIRL